MSSRNNVVNINAIFIFSYFFSGKNVVPNKTVKRKDKQKLGDSRS